jgi:hypothetical protein
LIPKKAGYFTETGFREHGLMDLDSLGWEEFIWQEQPFARAALWLSFAG